MRRRLNTLEGLALLEQLHTNINVDDRKRRLPKAVTVMLCNILTMWFHPFPNELPTALVDMSGQGKNIRNLCDGCSIDKSLSCSGIIWTPMNLSCPTYTSGRTPAPKILTIPSGPTSFAHRNIGTNLASARRSVVNEAMVHLNSCEKETQLLKQGVSLEVTVPGIFLCWNWALFYYMPVEN